MKKNLESYEYPGLQIKKKSWGFSIVNFFAEGGDLNVWAGVYRKEISQKGYQRILNPDHYNNIKSFLEREENVIPNSLVLAFNNQLDINGEVGDGAGFKITDEYHPVDPAGTRDEDTTISSGKLTVRVHEKCYSAHGPRDEISLSDYRSAFIIDGQHRIAGGNAVGINAYFPVSGFLGIKKEEQAFHFIVINRKAKKVSKHDIDAVIPKDIYANLQNRLVDAGIISNDADIVYGLDNQVESPFCSKIKWANNPNTEAPFNKGAIDAVIKEVRRLPEDILDQFNNELDILIAIWAGVKKHLAPLWDDKKYEESAEAHYHNQFLIKVVGVLPAIQKTINQALELEAIKIDPDSNDKKKSLTDSVYKWIKDLPLQTFYCEWKQKSITNDARREDLKTQIFNTKRRKAVPYGNEWFDEPVSIEEITAAKRVKAAQKRQKKKTKKSAKKN